MPDCRVELFAEDTFYDPIVVIGEIAHINAASPGGPRADGAISGSALNEYDNLIVSTTI
jgi:hypothetical protein